MRSIRKNHPKRSGWLTVFLLVILVANALNGSYFFLGGSAVKDDFSRLPIWMVPILAVLSFGNVLFAAAVWKWKKWGVYGLIITTLVVMGVGFLGGLPMTSSLLGVLGVVILIVLIRPAWKDLA